MIFKVYVWRRPIPHGSPSPGGRLSRLQTLLQTLIYEEDSLMVRYIFFTFVLLGIFVSCKSRILEEKKHEVLSKTLLLGNLELLYIRTNIKFLSEV